MMWNRNTMNNEYYVEWGMTNVYIQVSSSVHFVHSAHTVIWRHDESVMRGCKGSSPYYRGAEVEADVISSLMYDALNTDVFYHHTNHSCNYTLMQSLPVNSILLFVRWEWSHWQWLHLPQVWQLLEQPRKKT